MKEFEIFGPYTIPRKIKGAPFSTALKNQFWNNSIEEGGPDDLHEKIGCYIFAIRSGKGGILPYYVGKTNNGFKNEIFQADKINKYNEAFLSKNHGTPLMFFLIYPGRSSQTSDMIINELEWYLISLAFERNPEGLQNKHGVGKDWIIKYIMNPPKGPAPKVAREYKKIFR